MQAPQACVVDIQSKARSKWRPLPLDTVVSRLLYNYIKHCVVVMHYCIRYSAMQ